MNVKAWLWKQWRTLCGYVHCCLCGEEIEVGDQQITTFWLAGDYAHKACAAQEWRRQSHAVEDIGQ